MVGVGEQKLLYVCRPSLNVNFQRQRMDYDGEPLRPALRQLPLHAEATPDQGALKSAYIYQFLHRKPSLSWFPVQKLVTF